MGIFLIKLCMLVFMYSVIDGQKISKNISVNQRVFKKAAADI